MVGSRRRKPCPACHMVVDKYLYSGVRPRCPVCYHGDQVQEEPGCFSGLCHCWSRSKHGKVDSFVEDLGKG